jgi:hypothetical protein
MDSCLTARVTHCPAHLGGCALSPCGSLARPAGGGRTIPAGGSLACGRGASRSSPRGAPVCHDGTARPIPRPQDTTEPKACDSGKKKRHRLKNLLLINTAWRILFLSDTHPGSIHDKRIVDTPPSPLPAGSQWLQDLGCQAFTLDGVTIMHPTQKPRGHELTRAQKARHRKRARRRVRIAQVNSRVKRCRMRKETIRVWKAGVREMVMEIGDAWHHFRVRLTPSWAPMV